MGEDIVRLQGCNKSKYGQAYDAAETKTRFTSLLEFAGENGVVFRSHAEGSCTGFAMLFRMGGALHALCAGFEESDEKLGSYFECLYHAPIEWACENGIEEIDYGIGSVTAKAERGCSIIPVSTWYLPLSAGTARECGG